MTSVRKLEPRANGSTDYNASEVYMVTLTREDLATIIGSAITWGVDKSKALEFIINGGINLMNEILLTPSRQRRPEIA